MEVVVTPFSVVYAIEPPFVKPILVAVTLAGTINCLYFSYKVSGIRFAPCTCTVPSVKWMASFSIVLILASLGIVLDAASEGLLVNVLSALTNCQLLLSFSRGFH